MQQIQTQEARPPYVKFDRRPVEDVQGSKEAGRFVAKEVDYVMVTPPGTRDSFEEVAAKWIDKQKQKAQRGEIPHSWIDFFERSYKSFTDGHEMPAHGTPIRGWGLLSPAHQEVCIRANIRTVEDLAAASHEATARIGMGGLEFKEKAVAWLGASNVGATAEKMMRLEKENGRLNDQVSELTRRVENLLARLESGDSEEDSEPRKPRGRPRKVAS